MRLYQLKDIIDRFDDFDPTARVSVSQSHDLLISSELVPPMLEDMPGVDITGRNLFAVHVNENTIDSASIG